REHENQDGGNRGHAASPDKRRLDLEAVGTGDAMARVEIAVIEVGVIHAEFSVPKPGTGREVLRLEAGSERQPPLEPVFQPGMELEGDAAQVRLAGKPLIGE